MTINEKVEFLFFDPKRPVEEYKTYYEKVNSERFKREGNRYRISPLYMILRDIRYCFGVGKEFNKIKEDKTFKAA